MKTFIKLFIVAFAVGYLALAFVFSTWNIAEMPSEAKGGVMVFVLIVSVTVTAALEDMKRRS